MYDARLRLSMPSVDRFHAAHAWLVRHAGCGQQAGGYASDDEDEPQSCPCLWHPVAIGIAERESHLFVCRAWPGPVCGSCWSASCACGYVFDAVADAHARWPNGRLRAATPAPSERDRSLRRSSKPPPLRRRVDRSRTQVRD